MNYVRFVPSEIWYRGSVAASKLAAFAEVFVKEQFYKQSKPSETGAQASGRKAHEDMLNSTSPSVIENDAHHSEDSATMPQTDDDEPFHSSNLFTYAGVGLVMAGGITAAEISDSLFADSNTGMDINPATGLPMIDGIGSLDVAGNPYGSDSMQDSMSFDNSSMFDSSTTDNFDSFGSSPFDD